MSQLTANKAGKKQCSIKSRSGNRCAARSKQSGKQCRNLPARDREVCRFHGGATPKGFQSPHYKDGHRSKYLKFLPETKRSRFDETAADSAGVPSVSEELNLARIHLQEVLEMLEDSTMFDNWQLIRKRVKDLKEAIFNPVDLGDGFFEGFGTEETPEQIFQHIEELFVKTANAINTWAKVHDLSERIRKMEESNAKIRLQNLEEETERSELVPRAIFRKFVMDVGELFALSPETIRAQQLHGLGTAFDNLPEKVRKAAHEPKQLTGQK